MVIDAIALAAAIWAALEVYRWRLQERNNALLLLELGLLYAVVLRTLLLYQSITGWILPNSVELFSLFYIFLAVGLHFIRIRRRR